MLKRFVGVVMVAGAALPAFADGGAAQPDVTATTGYLAAGAATMLAIFGGKYVVKGAIRLGRWAQSVI